MFYIASKENKGSQALIFTPVYLYFSSFCKRHLPFHFNQVIHLWKFSSGNKNEWHVSRFHTCQLKSRTVLGFWCFVFFFLSPLSWILNVEFTFLKIVQHCISCVECGPDNILLLKKSIIHSLKSIIWRK